jgi:TetR/AcrR family transcriptional regulator, transcriptional repressor for nem operon
MMAADHHELPPEVDRFTEMNVRWLVKVLSLQKPVVANKAVQRLAHAVFAAIEGAQLVARGRADVAVFDEIVESYRKAGLIP